MAEPDESTVSPERTALVPAPVFDDEPPALAIGKSPPPEAFELESTTDSQAELPNFPVREAEVRASTPASEESAEITRRVSPEVVSSVRAAFADLPRAPSPELHDTLPPVPAGPLFSGAAEDLSATAIDEPLPRSVLAALEGRRVVERNTAAQAPFDPLDRADTPPIGKRAPLATPPLRLPAAAQEPPLVVPTPPSPEGLGTASPVPSARPPAFPRTKAPATKPSPIQLSERRRTRAALLTPMEGSLALLFVAVVMYLLSVAPPAGSRSVSLVTRAAPEPPPVPARPPRPSADRPRPAPPAPLIPPGLSPAETQAALEKLAAEVGPTPQFDGEGE
ncbi:MAG: hypothetical protein IPG45_08385 [Deltaproteobacteria bacterium]|nr:hypothetical protein [Deltaproteobacteria bacterium]